MPLPSSDTVWPPRPLVPAHDQMRIWKSWYQGDPDVLAETYQVGPGRVRTRPAQRMGGVVGAVARFFWGRPNPPHQARSRLHVPLATDIAEASANLLFADPPTFTAADERAQARLDAGLNTAETHSALLESAEIGAALGGTFLRIVWDRELSDSPWLDPVNADAAVPEWRWGRMVAVTFWRTLPDPTGSGITLRHLERHERGRVLHGLYAGGPAGLGRPVPLTEHTETEPLARLVDADGAIPTGTDHLTAGYVPNMRPAPAWMDSPELADLGRSDYAAAEPTLDALDETYSSWMRDVKLAKARILVPSGYLSNQGPGAGATWDDDQEVFQELDMLGSAGSLGEITPQQFAIRVAEHRDTCAELRRIALDRAGLSPATMGRDDEGPNGARTATEVEANTDRSELTRKKKSRYWGAALGALGRAWLDVDAMLNPSGAPTERDAGLEWPDRSKPNPAETANTVEALRRAEAASTETLVAMANPNLSGDELKTEVGRVLAETGRMVPDPETWRGD